VQHCFQSLTRNSNRLREIPITYAKFKSLTRNSNSHAKFKFSREIQILTRNSNRLREIPITYAKFKISRENSNAHARTFHILRQGHLGQRLRSTWHTVILHVTYCTSARGVKNSLNTLTILQKLCRIFSICFVVHVAKNFKMNIRPSFVQTVELHQLQVYI
jgi:hypothetical protein